MRSKVPSSRFTIVRYDNELAITQEGNDPLYKVSALTDLDAHWQNAIEFADDGLDMNEILQYGFKSAFTLLDMVINIATFFKLRDADVVLAMIDRDRLVHAGIDHDQFLEDIAFCKMRYSELANMRGIKSWRVFLDPTSHLVGIAFEFESRESFLARLAELSDVIGTPVYSFPPD